MAQHGAMRFGRTAARGLLAGALLVGPMLAWGAPTAGAAARVAPIPSSGAMVADAPALSPWRGGVDLYRAGTFTTQQTWLWCTAAAIQITRNIVLHQQDHSYAGQQRYFDWMRAHNRYSIPLSGGVDAQGWAAGFQHFVDRRYRLYASSSFDAALRSAVVNLRRTNLPVGITVDRGNHAWLLTGFTATADPAATTHFTVTSVRVVGPLYGLQSKNGYDMPPDTRLTPSQLRHYLTPWYYPPVRMAWDGKYVSVQPVAAAASPTAKPKPTATRRPSPTPTTAPTPAPTVAPTPSPSLEPAGAPPSPAATAGASPPAQAMAAPTHSPADRVPPATAPAGAVSPGIPLALAAVAVLVALAAGGALVLARRR